MDGEEASKQQPVSLEEIVKQGNEKISKLEVASFDTRIYFQEQIKQVGEKMKEVEQKIDSIKQVGEKMKEFEQKIDSSKINVIEALGIFVALFTFIAVNVQIFSKINDLGSAMWFMLGMGGITLTILLSVELLIDGHRAGSTPEKPTWLQSLRNIVISKFGALIFLAVLEMAIGLIFTYRNHVQLNNGSANTSTKLEIQADIKSKNDSAIILDVKDLNKLLPKQ